MGRGNADRVLVATALTLALIPLFTSNAPAAVGDLTPSGCIDDNDSGIDGCIQSTDGLDGARGVAVSPDGKSVYVATSVDSAVVRFDRDPETGALTLMGCIDDNDTGADACGQSADGLGGALSVDVTSDGRSVYVIGDGDAAVVRFDRDIQTGVLTPMGCIDDNDTGADACGQSADGLDGAHSVSASSNGKSVYVAAEDDDALVRFDRDTQTGALTPMGCIDDNDTGADNCAQSADGLQHAQDAVVSSDGKSVYVASQFDDAVVRFDRDTQTGALTPMGCIDDNDSGPEACAQSADGLDGPRGVGISPDGSSVYAATSLDSAVVRFDRDSETGALTPMGCVEDNDSGPDGCAQSTNGLQDVQSVAVSADGASTYATAEDDDAVVRFDRDRGTGALTPLGCIDDNDTGADACGVSVDGLDHTRDVVVSPDGKSVYVAAQNDDALVRFDREADTVPPETTITGGPNGPTADSTPTFTFESSEPGSSFECRVDGGAFSPCSRRAAHTTGALSDGPHTFEVRATDTAGNRETSPATRSFTVDTDPPQTTIRSGPNAKTTDRTPTFKFKSDEPGSGFECKLDNKRFRTCKSPKTYGRLGLGVHTFRVRATDPAGNTDATPAKKTFEVVMRA